jgi:uncharacterized protein (DUF1800 family)
MLLASSVATPSRAAAPSAVDLQWLGRITFGIDSAGLARYEKIGRRRFLDEQLAARDAGLPASIAGEVTDAKQKLAAPDAQFDAIAEENRRIKDLPDGEEKQAARKAQRERANQLAYQAARIELLRAVYSPAQLKEQMTWFWLNHFSVFQDKANLRWLVGDYAERAIRPHALGHFRDLVMATLTHPAMLEYLDNAQNAKGHVNENYARELMELHTLGVDAGYTQDDVQQLARVLTGVGIDRDGGMPKLSPQWQALYRRDAAFEFNPARHDFGDKTLFGKTVEGGGFDEVAHAVDLIVRQPACAAFVSRKLAEYFVADQPPRALIERMAKTFRRSDGDIAAVLRVLFESRELDASLGRKFRDPMQFVVASMRLAYDGRPIANAHPLVNWLNSLGEPLFGRPTPDGYPLTESAWASSGQLSRRFDIAHAIAAGNAGLFDPEDGSAADGGGFPRLSSRLFFAAIEPHLGERTRTALDHAGSQQEWNTLLLASPDANYR